ncbi:Zinc finger and SCAN domain-containing [Argiope bruennichi]|uniref:Zinc finger and SCAN domain-containing n=1 Tax=Argiope bruennichi TaxID=94029 RepID=A0A8T0E3Y0_ARGBR|nr:Zinc finger and SCAN domain-containing [Argiope bruennichi]
MDDQPLDLSSTKKSCPPASEGQQKSTEGEKQIPVVGKSSLPFKKRKFESTSATSDSASRSILESLLTRPNKNVQNVSKEKSVLTEGLSPSSGEKSHGASGSSSIITAQKEHKLTQHSSSDDMTRKEDAIELSKSAGASENSDFSDQESSSDSDNGRPYGCIHCNKSFDQPVALVYHFRIHGKPFICKCCKKKYRQAPDFIKHIQKHAGEGGTPFSCPDCSKGLCRKVNLNKHLTIHRPKKKDSGKHMMIHGNSPKTDMEKHEIIHGDSLSKADLEKQKAIHGNSPNKVDLEQHMTIRGNSSNKVDIEKQKIVHGNSPNKIDQGKHVTIPGNSPKKVYLEQHMTIHGKSPSKL